MQLRRVSVWLLLCALLAAQTFGLVHRVAHGSGASQATQASTASPASMSGWAQDLFAGHEGDPSCKLFDQLNACGAMPELPAIALPMLAPLFFLSWSQGEVLSRWATLFDARGPPFLR